MNNNLDKYKQIYFIRKFEELLFNLFDKGFLNGTIHTCIGQEADAVGVIQNLKRSDIIFSNHRCHGHYLAHGGDPYLLLREIMGYSDGLCGGIGGSQHICDKNFYSNGIQGSYMPIILGMAFAEKYFHKSDKIVVGFIGDGTLGQGTVYESLNMISLYDVPVLLVIENNGIAQSTPLKNNFSGSISKRIDGFNIKHDEISSTDVDAIYDIYKKNVEYVRTKKKPFVGVINTCRLGPHSKGEDTRDSEYLLKLKEKDPIKIIESKIPSDDRDRLIEIVDKEINLLLTKTGVCL